MANTASKPKPQTYYIAYGFLGGALTGIRMRRLLRKSGYKRSRFLADADIVLAHSAGCWELNNIKIARLVFLVGLPLAEPSLKLSSYNAQQMTKIALANRHYLHILGVRLNNLVYGLFQPRRNLSIIRNISQLQAVFQAPKATQIVCIANRHDPWPRADNMQSLIDEEPWAFISLGGSHDDIWEHPDRYVEIINHYAGLLG